VSTDLSGLFRAVPGPAEPMTFRQGTIVEFSQATLENKVRIGGPGGPVFENLPLLGVAEAASLTTGSEVGILIAGATWGIIGRFVSPATPQAIEAVTLVSQRTVTDRIDTFETRSLGTFGDLATPGPAVVLVVPASGRVEVHVSAYVDPDFFCAVGVAVSGPTTVVPDIWDALQVEGNVNARATASFVIADLAPGLPHTFTMKYISDGQPTNFGYRTLIVKGL
jgi:hypothetical protein